ncbi:MAG: peptide chain release factor N(5)-glutamine methyltransferase [Ignavibacteriaceae bacterium]|nr:peptide chain release factor N(5)-glutamine methyltransferase [Ignavibacteriaceae bacterium]
MHTILELLNLTTNFFEQKGIDSARLNAELLLAEILKCKRLDLYLAFDKPVKEEEVDNYRGFVKRRGNREPLQYILGYVEFYGLTFSVNKDVLIPRQETEILVETILNSTDKETQLNILDIGTGSGIIAVTLAKHLPNVKIFAVDKSSEALTVTKQNAETHNVSQRITYLQNDVLISSLPIDGKLDIIVSNPPYVSQLEFHSLQKEIIAHEPDFAVTDFSDGLTFYRKIIESSKKYLNENGKIFFELGAGQSAQVKSLFELHNFSSIEIRKDYSNIDRVIKGEWK